MKSQKQKLLNYLLTGRRITQLQALSMFGIMRLASRINNLRNDGYDIETKPIAVRNRSGKKVLVAQYSI